MNIVKITFEECSIPQDDEAMNSPLWLCDVRCLNGWISIAMSTDPREALKEAVGMLEIAESSSANSPLRAYFEETKIVSIVQEKIIKGEYWNGK
jgi:hypothetical protein